MIHRILACLILLCAPFPALEAQHLQVLSGPATIEHQPFYNGRGQAGVASPNMLQSNGFALEGSWRRHIGRLTHRLQVGYHGFRNFELTNPSQRIKRPDHQYTNLQLEYGLQHHLFDGVWRGISINPGGLLSMNVTQNRLHYPEAEDQDYILYRAAALFSLYITVPIHNRLISRATISNGGFIGGIRHKVPRNDIDHIKRDLGWMSRANLQLGYRLNNRLGINLQYQWEQWLSFNELYSSQLTTQQFKLGVRYFLGVN